jgi:hypothetical protein
MIEFLDKDRQGQQQIPDLDAIQDGIGDLGTK